MKKMFMAGAVIVSVMAFAASAHNVKNQHVYRSGIYRIDYSSRDTVPKKDTTKDPKKDSTLVDLWK
jgi:hypothetical protein